MMSQLVSALMRYQLRRSFRRVGWVGPRPVLPDDTPIVLYANHHHFFDGHLLWYLITRMLRRPALTWMAEWDRFPFFAAVGAQPFPPDDARRRRATLRRTARRFRAAPDSVLVYFPEGTLHPPEEGILPVPAERFVRLSRLFPTAHWWPVALHVTWHGDAFPTALLAGGTPHAPPTGDEHERLTARWTTLRTTPTPYETLLEGRRSPSDTWRFRFARRFFERYL